MMNSLKDCERVYLKLLDMLIDMFPIAPVDCCSMNVTVAHCCESEHIIQLIVSCVFRGTMFLHKDTFRKGLLFPPH